MKATTAQYAVALLDAVRGKNEPDVERVVAGFVDVLKQDGMLSRCDAVLRRFADLWDAVHGIVEAKISSSFPLDEDDLGSLRNYLLRKYGAKEIVLLQTIDKKLLGGVRIEAQGEVLDATVLERMHKLRDSLSK